jgi:hypothetical protein
MVGVVWWLLLTQFCRAKIVLVNTSSRSLYYMPPPSEPSITPPNEPSTPPELSLPSTEDQTTPKPPPTLPPPLLNLPQNGEINLMPPPSFTRPPQKNTTSTLSPSLSTLPPQKRPRQKVILAPGHSPLDWARLKSTSTDLRVPTPL